MSYTVACPLISGIAACGFGLIESFKNGYLVAWFVGRCWKIFWEGAGVVKDRAQKSQGLL